MPGSMGGTERLQDEGTWEEIVSGTGGMVSIGDGRSRIGIGWGSDGGRGGEALSMDLSRLDRRERGLDAEEERTPTDR